MKLTVHHLNNSRSQRVLWLLEELQLPYAIQHYQRDAKTMLAPPSLKRVHPLGKSPVLTDGDTVIAESGAIIEYLVDTYGQGRLKPAVGTPERQRYTYWMHYAEGSAMPPLVMKLVFGRLKTAPMPFFIKPIARGIANQVLNGFVEPQIRLHVGHMEASLMPSGWFVGEELSAADVQMSFPVEAAAARGGLGSEFPRLTGFLERIRARPAYQRALEKGGPYALMR
ncbi:MAG TPA: glutathione S-transferase [Verrucomicrobiae bacterium]|nr:glutathione S-transferase [Verrucomicrobiae bacterium]